MTNYKNYKFIWTHLNNSLNASCWPALKHLCKLIYYNYKKHPVSNNTTTFSYDVFPLNCRCLFNSILSVLYFLLTECSGNRKKRRIPSNTSQSWIRLSRVLLLRIKPEFKSNIFNLNASISPNQKLLSKAKSLAISFCHTF